MKFNSITVCPVRSLEVGDLIAKEFVSTIVSGKITALVYAPYQLTDEQREYMKARDLIIPDNEYAAIAGHGSVLIFGDFRGYGMNEDQPNHMYVGMDVNVAVFPTSR